MPKVSRCCGSLYFGLMTEYSVQSFQDASVSRMVWTNRTEGASWLRCYHVCFGSPGAVGDLHGRAFTGHAPTLGQGAVTCPRATHASAGALPVVVVTRLPWGPGTKGTILGQISHLRGKVRNETECNFFDLSTYKRGLACVRAYVCVTHWTLSDVLAPLAHVGAVLDGGAAPLLAVPATVGVSGLQAEPTGPQHRDSSQLGPPWKNLSC